MPRLFSYTILRDDGAAPNPFRGLCTLAICKPQIRRKAAVGDWVVGLGSKRAPSGNLAGRMVCAMRVDQVLTLRDYDRLAPTHWPHRVPNLQSAIMSDRLGDCIYDFFTGIGGEFMTGRLSRAKCGRARIIPGGGETSTSWPRVNSLPTSRPKKGPLE